MKEIKLINSELVALVDDADFEWLNRFKWYAERSGTNTYAARSIYLGGGKDNRKATTIKMHRQILCLTNRKIKTDHIDHNGLNNTRQNLRAVTNQQNIFNQRKTKKHTSIYKGVSLRKRTNKWISQICFNGKSISLGTYKNEIDAAKAYDTAALKYFGQYAFTNANQKLVA